MIGIVVCLLRKFLVFIILSTTFVMKPVYFYGKKTYPNAGHEEEKSDDSDLSNSDDDPDYVPHCL